MRTLILFGLAAVIANPALAWDGYDYDSSTYVEIDSGNRVRPGETIEFYDYDSGEYHAADVESVNRFGSTVEVEVYDHESGESRTFEMDD